MLVDLGFVTIVLGGEMKAYFPQVYCCLLVLKHTFEEINIIAIQYAMSIILHKRRIENNKPLPTGA